MKLAHSIDSKMIHWRISYSQPHYIPFFIDIADKFDSLFINVFANNAAFLGSLSQILVLQDIYCARIREIDLLLNPQESIIYIPNKDPTYSAPLAMNRNANTLHF